MSDISLKKIIIANYFGFCMGVEKAISMTEQTMKKYKKVTILNEIVHNEAVVNNFARAGVNMSKSIDSIDGGAVIISAHGVSPDIYLKANKHGLKIVDASCPLVIRIHKIIKRLAENGYSIIHFGDPEHDETIGIVGHAPEKVTVLSDSKNLDSIEGIKGKIALTSQTTAHASDFAEVERKIRKKHPQVETFNTICNATNQRQTAILQLAPDVDMMLVVGSSTSANSNRLVQISKSICKLSYLINSAEDINLQWFLQNGQKIKTVGLSAGASTPDFLIEGAIEKLREIAASDVEIVYPPKREKINSLVVSDEIV